MAAVVEIRGHYTVDPSGDTGAGRGTRFETDPAGALLGAAVPWESRATRLVPLPPDGVTP